MTGETFFEIESLPDVIKVTASLYSESELPAVFMDSDLDILWANRSFMAFLPEDEPLPVNICDAFDLPLENLSMKPPVPARKSVSITSRIRQSFQANLIILPGMSSAGEGFFIGILDDISSETRQVVRKTYTGLLEASKLKDNDTGNHIERVGLYSSRIAEEIYKHSPDGIVTPDFIENIRFLAPMHDVGKIGTPDEILNKKGPLNESEWAIMKEHTINGAYILANYPDEMAKHIALFHHEKWNGSGYPYGLEGVLIPLEARITTIADIYDALRMKRSYKDPFDHDTAVEMILKESGKIFDPDLAAVFSEISRDFDRIFTEMNDTAGENHSHAPHRT